MFFVFYPVLGLRDCVVTGWVAACPHSDVPLSLLDGARIYSNLLRRESVLGLQNAAVSGSSARSVAQRSNLLLNLCTRLPEKPKVSMVLFTVLIIGA